MEKITNDRVKNRDGHHRPIDDLTRVIIEVKNDKDHCKSEKEVHSKEDDKLIVNLDLVSSSLASEEVDNGNTT